MGPQPVISSESITPRQVSLLPLPLITHIFDNLYFYEECGNIKSGIYLGNC